MKFWHCDLGALLTAVWVASALVIMAPSKSSIDLQKAAIDPTASVLIWAQIVNSQFSADSDKRHLDK